MNHSDSEGVSRSEGHSVCHFYIATATSYDWGSSNCVAGLTSYAEDCKSISHLGGHDSPVCTWVECCVP